MTGCLLVIIGSDETGRAELLALPNNYRESEKRTGRNLKQRGLEETSWLAAG